MKNYSFFVFLLSFLILVGTACASNSTTDHLVDSDEPHPSFGGSIYDIFNLRHFGAQYNTDIMTFINTYGLDYFYESRACDVNQSYYYVYLLPEKEYSKELVYLELHDERGINNSIIWVRLLDKNTELPRLNDSECIALGISGNSTIVTANPDDNDGVINIWSIIIGIAIILTLLLAVVAIIKTMR
jgi:hypothetical protein